MPGKARSVCFVSAVEPYPTDAGKKVVLAGFVDYLVDRFGPDHVHYLLVGGERHERRDFPAVLHEIPGPSTARALANVAGRTLTGRASLQESLLRSPVTSAAIARTIDMVAPDLEIYDTIRLGQYAAPERAMRQICYLDDLFSERYGTMLAASARFPDVDVRPLGNFARHVPALLRPLASRPLPQQALLRVERSLVRRSEDKAARYFRRSLLVSEHEAALLRSRAGLPTGRVQAVPPLLCPPFSVLRRYSGAPEFVFLGLLSLPHNDDGLTSFLHEVWPKVLERRADARLKVVGRQPRPELEQLVARHAGSVTLEGFMEDLETLLTRAAALINPLRFGSGIKLKVLEALGRGLPVVSSPTGAEGIEQGDSWGVVVVSTPEATADALVDLTDPAVNEKASTAALNHFASRYSRAVVFSRYDDVFNT